MAEDIRCPICNLNLQVFTDRQREEHCDECLDNTSTLSPPGEHTSRSVKLQNTRAGHVKLECSVVPAPNQSSRASEPLLVDDLLPKCNENPVANESLLSDCSTQAERAEVKRETAAQWSSLLGKRAVPAPPRSTRLKSSPKVASSTAGTVQEEGTSLEKGHRSMPYFKTLTFGKTKLAVDAFSYGAIPGVEAYFLTHFHSDHYGRLGKHWTHGNIYCSPATARLAALRLKVRPEFLHPLELDKEHSIQGISVIFLDANHCPGATVILFNKHTLHTGDFRATPQLALRIKSMVPLLRATYLDTTYLDPDRRFPSQDIVVQTCVEYTALQQEKPVEHSFFLRRPEQRRLLVLVGTYTIGKERLALAVARKLRSKIWTSPQKRKVLETIDDPEINELLDDDGLRAQVHLASMYELSMAKLEDKWRFLKRHFTHMLAFVPTGWTWPKKGTEFTVSTLEEPRTTTVSPNGSIRICRVPYSEHSSFSELEEFCRLLPSEKLIPTVHTSRYDILRSWEL